MTQDEGVDERAIAQALAAIGVADLDGARASLEAAAEAGGGPEVWELLGGVCLFDDDLDRARRSFETAFRLWRDHGEGRRAALAAATLADVHTSWLGNRAAGKGWIERARRALQDSERCVERGYVELALLACDTENLDDVLEAASTALELAREFADPELEVRALADSGYALVVQGRLDEGFARLDEAMAALSAGEVRNPATASMSYCALLSACDRTGDVARAEEWTRVVRSAMTAPLNDRPRALHMHCRLVYGSVLCTSGRLEEGEAELIRALGPDASAMHIHRGEASARLASLRILQGRVDEAAALLGPYSDRPAACEPLARVHLARRELDLADAVARRGLGMVTGDCLRAASLLAVLVEIAIVADDLDGASAHVDALGALGSSSDCRLITADAALAGARLAAARLDAASARSSLERALTLARADERPLVGALVSLELAVVLGDLGDRGGAVDHARAAIDVFERLGATPMVDRASALLRSLGATAGIPRRSAELTVAGLTAREQQVLDLLREGLTNAEIGTRLYISAKTAEHHVGRVLGKLGVRSRAEAAAIAAAAAVGRGSTPE